MAFFCYGSSLVSALIYDHTLNTSISIVPFCIVIVSAIKFDYLFCFEVPSRELKQLSLRNKVFTIILPIPIYCQMLIKQIYYLLPTSPLESPKSNEISHSRYFGLT